MRGKSHNGPIRCSSNLTGDSRGNGFRCDGMFSHLLFTVGALCAFLLAATMGISSARGFVLMLMGAVLSWAPDWIRGLSWAATVGALYMLVLRVCADPCIRNSGPE